MPARPARPLARRVSSLALAAAMAGAGGALSGCKTNAATGRSILSTMSLQEQVSLGEQARPQMLQEFGGEVPSPELRAYVEDVGRRMLPHIEGEYRDLPWTFTLLNSPVINAFALPGGKVFMSRGLAEKLTNEAQLAGVLGHEIGHVTAEHTNERFSQATVAQVAGGLIGAAAGAAGSQAVTEAAGLVVNVGGQLVLLKYSRGQEIEADYLGMRYMSRAGWNPLGQQQVMEILARESQGPRQPEMFATHPDPASRVDIIRKRLAGPEFRDTQLNADRFATGEDTYRARFLDVARRLPPAPRPKQASAEIDWNNPLQWCGVCRASAGLDAAPETHAHGYAAAGRGAGLTPR
ncbi:MAG: M48 family metallopeptidase [Phycisphaerales bacterium]|nr:M48 family metallopeptidase [Phycisphaerales bacterium]